MIPTKIIKNEMPMSNKDIKQENSSNSHQLHSKDLSQSMGPYSNMFQRQGIGVPPPQQQHITREEDLRR